MNMNLNLILVNSLFSFLLSPFYEGMKTGRKGYRRIRVGGCNGIRKTTKFKVKLSYTEEQEGESKTFVEKANGKLTNPNS